VLAKRVTSVPGPPICHVFTRSVRRFFLDRISDEELLSGTRRLVGRSNQLLASLVAHLGEVEARGIVQATCPVRELAPGDRPRDWMQAADESAVGALDDREGPVAREGTVATTSTAPVQVASIASAAGAALARIDSMALASDAALARIDSMAFAADAALATLARVDSMALASDAALGRVGAIVPPPSRPSATRCSSRRPRNTCASSIRQRPCFHTRFPG
jgi:hypothetical protein